MKQQQAIQVCTHLTETKSRFRNTSRLSFPLYMLFLVEQLLCHGIHNVLSRCGAAESLLKLFKVVAKQNPADEFFSFFLSLRSFHVGNASLCCTLCTNCTQEKPFQVSYKNNSKLPPPLTVEAGELGIKRKDEKGMQAMKRNFTLML